jgi:hypothetical protein
MSAGKGGTVVSWAHQRTRGLADQLLDDAYNVRQRGAALARVVGMASADAVVAARDAAWVVGDAFGRLFGRRDRGGSPLGPVAPLAVLRAVDEHEVAWDD